MDGIQRPTQAVVRQPCEMNYDQEQQSETISRRELSRTSFSKWKQEHRISPQITRILTIIMSELPRPKYTSVLPYFSIQPTPQPPTENLALSALDQVYQDLGPRRRNISACQTTEHTGAGDQSAWASGGKPPNVSKKGRRKIVNTPKAKHEKRKKEILKILEPILNGEDLHSHSILLCWGKRSHFQILPVKIAHSADDVAVWQEVRRAWYAHKGGRRMRLPFFGIREVNIVDISIAGCGSQGTPKSTFIGTYTNDYLIAEKGRLEQTIADYVPQEFPCSYNPSTGRTACLHECISSIIEEAVCPEQKLHYAERELLRLEMRPYLTLAFSYPSIAAANGLLDGEDIAISQLDILSKIESWHCPKLGELKFRGLMINEGWDTDSQHMTLSLATAVLFLMVFVAKLVFGDWGTAWNVASVLVALATFSWMWINHSVGREMH